MSWIYEVLEEAERQRQRQGKRLEVSLDPVIPRQPEIVLRGTEPAILPQLDQDREITEYQKLRTAMQTIPGSRRSQGIVVCSSTRREGASKVAADLAIVCTLQNATRVLLVDANLRHPDVHRRFHIKRDPGLTNILAEGRLLPEQEICPSAIPKLFLLPAGDAPLDPTTAFESSAFKTILCHVGEAYDYVILDSGPVHSCPETLTLAEQAGAVVLVVRAEWTRIEVVQAARDRLHSRGAHLCGAVLNQRKYYIPNLIYRLLSVARS
jgi:capsular exopolysaccharide synthesis family protein